MSVRVLPRTGAGWTIPANTLSMRVGGPHVAIVNEVDQVEIRKVTLGRNLGRTVIVTAGIHGTERLVVNPGDDLTDGSQVRIRDTEAAQAVARRGS